MLSQLRSGILGQVGRFYVGRGELLLRCGMGGDRGGRRNHIGSSLRCGRVVVHVDVLHALYVDGRSQLGLVGDVAMLPGGK